jgi:Na+/glutamate symporter
MFDVNTMLLVQFGILKYQVLQKECTSRCKIIVQVVLNMLLTYLMHNVKAWLQHMTKLCIIWYCCCMYCCCVLYMFLFIERLMLENFNKSSCKDWSWRWRVGYHTTRKRNSFNWLQRTAIDYYKNNYYNTSYTSYSP